MKKHRGTAVPLELAAAVVEVFKTDKSIEVLAPMWGEKANPEHLWFELYIRGITPGLYAGPVIATIDLTREAYILRQMEDGIDRKQAERNAHSDLLKHEDEWRLETTQTLTDQKRANIVRSFAYMQLEKQIVLRDMAAQAFSGKTPVFDPEISDLKIDHVRIDKWVAGRLSQRRGGLQNEVRDELRNLLTSRDVIREGLSLLLIRRSGSGHWWVTMETVKTGPQLLVEERILTDADIDLATFDGKYVRIYGPKVTEVPNPDPNETLGEYLSVVDEDLAKRKIISLRRARPEGETDILVEVESDMIAVSEF